MALLIVIPTLQVKKLRPKKEVKDLAQGHIATKQQSQDSTFVGVTFKASALNY